MVKIRFELRKNLRGLVSEENLEREVDVRMKKFESCVEQAQKRIPCIELTDLFSQEIECDDMNFSFVPGPWGGVTFGECRKICLISRWLQPKGIFEFGTYSGETTLQLALNSPDGCVIYTLDVESDDSGNVVDGLDVPDRLLVLREGDFYTEVGVRFKEQVQVDKIVQLWGDSTKLDLSEYYGKIDLVFVDGGHSYGCVKSDSENALRMICADGVVIWHDYLSALDSDVTLYLGELSLRADLFHLQDTNLVVYRVYRR